MNSLAPITSPPPEKFRDRHVTATGEARAFVSLKGATTLWFNTGTLCNIECVNCYIESSPVNDRLVYLDADDIRPFLDQIKERNWPVREIGFTGGEPFMNPAMIDMARLCLMRGYRVLILTNAMRPMMRPGVQAGIRNLLAEFGDQLTFRISVDHPDPARNDAIRGAGSFAKTLEGMLWLDRHGARMDVAGRTLWGETEAESRKAFAAFYRRHGFSIDAGDPVRTMLFPEMDQNADVPEITTACWSILNKKPDEVMCATSRMVVKRKGAARPVVLACTLIPDDAEFELGETLKQAEGPVHLNHPHCARFCVLGGASCSA